MRLSSVPGQGAAFAGVGDGPGAVAVLPAPAQSAAKEPARAVARLVRIGNGALVVREPGQTARTPTPPASEVAYRDPAATPEVARPFTPSGSHRFLAY
jgi:hypothetical protein